MTALALLQPLDVAVASFALVVVPILTLMTVWACVTVARIVFPERELPFDETARRERARRRGTATPVRFRDLVEDQRHAPSPAMPEAARTGAPDERTGPSPLAEDLWLRRN